MNQPDYTLTTLLKGKVVKEVYNNKTCDIVFEDGTILGVNDLYGQPVNAHVFSPNELSPEQLGEF